MQWQILVAQLINGIALGSTYALIALGYTMVYGIIRLINFAHGDIFMLGAYFGLIAISTFKLPLVPAMLLSMLAAAVVGIVLDRVAYRPLRQSPRITVLITAIGASLLIQSLSQLIFGADFRSYPATAIPIKIIRLGSVIITNRQIIIFGTAIVLMILLHLIVNYTKFGKAMRAVSMDKEAAQLMGINVDRIIALTFAIGSALAAAAGILVGILYNSVDPYMGTLPGLKAFVAAVLGGIGIIPGAVIGGFLMGIAENLVVAFGSSTYRDAVAFAILILILLIKPSGLLGKRVHEKV
ncbi:MAG TPA: branched-chain amino acid ABC transporter permease [Firmicutes bacterium]|jgi:branched-chain amino acid transport system permease protein|nr:branched-chain amino acid ABC transporter permease [Bacillota bacterium]